MKKRMAWILALAMLLSVFSIGQAVLAKSDYVELKAENFNKVIDGKEVKLYTLKNKNGMVAKITNYGGKIVQLLVPDKNGNLGDVVLGYESIDKTLEGGQKSMGSTIGRVANRIANGKFTLDGVSYQLAINDNPRPHTLHGGKKGSRFVVFDAKQIDDHSLQLTYYFKDGEEGFPGNCLLKAMYILTDDNALKLTFDATTDKKTIVNFLNHAFFNLAGEGKGDILNHELCINADSFTPVDKTLIPTGEIRSVAGTPLDFRKMHKIGDKIDAKDDQIIDGYDHNFVLNKKDGDELSLAAKVYEPASGRVMEVWTTQPGMQFYSGNFLNGAKDFGKGDKPYVKRGAFCLETQHFPDSVNHANFPSIVLEPGQWFTSTSIYKFSVKK